MTAPIETDSITQRVTQPAASNLDVTNVTRGIDAPHTDNTPDTNNVGTQERAADGIDDVDPLTQNIFSLFARQAERNPDAVAIIGAVAVTYRDLAERASAIAENLVRRGLPDQATVGVLMHRDPQLIATLLGVFKAGFAYVPLDPEDPPERARLMVVGSRCSLVIGNADLLARLKIVLTDNLTDNFNDTDSADGSSPQHGPELRHPALRGSELRSPELLGAELRGPELRGPEIRWPEPHGLELVDVNRIGVRSAQAIAAPATCAEGGERLAYVLFTSGSTGQPKGIEVEHRSVANLLLAARDLLGFTERDRYLAVSTVGFDISVAELFLPLVTGGSLLLRDRHLLMQPTRMAEEIARHKVTVVQTGPSVWSAILDAVSEFPRVRVAITTGEAVSPATAQRLCDVADHVWNLYGPTETTVWATAHEVSKHESTSESRYESKFESTSSSAYIETLSSHELASMAEKLELGSNTVASSVSAPIGTPLSNIDAMVVDESGHRVDNGIHGELWLSGIALARGYCGNPKLTRERFVVVDSGHRWYRTGDLVAQDDDGVLHYFGRNDDQIKVRGVRIEPMEVESALLSTPGVERAAATWFDTGGESRSLIAAIVRAPGASVNPRDLHDHVAGLLPPAMVPSRFIFVEALPLSPSGKIDRKAIRAEAAKRTHEPNTHEPNAHEPNTHEPNAHEPNAHEPNTHTVATADTGPADLSQTISGAGAEPAMTDTERRMRDIWERTLRISEITREDHFFTIGGDSLVAVAMAMSAEDEFGVSIPIRTLFESPTLRRFAARIDELMLGLDATSGPIDSNELQGSGRRHGVDDREPNANFVFPLVDDGAGRAVFFNSVDLKMARRGLWNLDCPLYAISHWAQGTGFVRADTVEELAAVHVRGLKSIQPHGPYRIAGFSFGGLLAVEMAQQLHRSGDTVEILFLLDPSEPSWVDAVPLNRHHAERPYTQAGPTASRSLTSWAKGHLAAAPRSPVAAANYVRTRARQNGRYLYAHILNLGGRFSAWQWLNYQLVHLHGRHPGAVSTRLLPHDRWPAFWYASVRLAKSYKVRPYTGKVVTVFSSRGEAFAAWPDLLGERHTSYVIDGHHLDMFSDSAISEWTAVLHDALVSLPTSAQ